jgi:tRNA G18 (ribose-2'-O)-methylase SpoU
VPTGRFDDAPRPWIGLVPRGGTALAEVELGERATFVLGAERDGLPAALADSCDALVSIPLAKSAESLNVAAAGAIALYERVRRSIS